MKKIIFIIFSLFLFSCIRIDTAKEGTKQQTYKGAITKIYQDKWNHMAYTFDIKTSGELIIDVVDIWPKIWGYAAIGDSIIKPADTLIIIVKKNDSTFKEFQYKF